MVGAYCGWNPSNSIAQMTKMNGNPHIWRLKIDMPFVEASDNGVKFVGNNAFGNNYVPVDQWSNPYGVCELNPAGSPLRTIRFSCRIHFTASVALAEGKEMSVVVPYKLKSLLLGELLLFS